MTKTNMCNMTRRGKLKEEQLLRKGLDFGSTFEARTGLMLLGHRGDLHLQPPSHVNVCHCPHPPSKVETS